jgi:FMN reductase
VTVTRAGASIVVISAGLSQPSSTRLLADRLSDAVAADLVRRGVRADLEVVELREWARDVTNNLLTGFASEGLRALLDRVAAADAVIAVSPIFSASYSGLFKTFFDVLDVDALVGTPVLIAATGGSARHSLALEHALRPLFSYLRAAVVPTAVYAATEDWASDGDLAARMDRAADELATVVSSRTGLGPASNRTPDRAGASVSEDSGDVIPFARLLAAQRAAAVQQR